MVIRDQLPSLRQWAANRLRCDFGQCLTLANEVNGEILAVVVFHNSRKTSCEISVVSRSPKWATPDFIQAVFGFGFLHWNRLYSLVAPDNVRASRLAKRLGFQYEGCLREAADSGSDLHMYALLKREWDGKKE